MTRGLGQWAIRIVAGLTGFVILPLLLGNVGMLGGIHELIWSVLGAVLGFVFALFMADRALIILSALLGAGLIMSGAQQLDSDFASAAFDRRLRIDHHRRAVPNAVKAVSLLNLYPLSATFA